MTDKPTAPDLAALSEAYTKSPNALSLTLLGHALVNEYRAGRLVQIDEGMRERVELCVAVCSQCEGEGGYPDGMDEAACHTDCTRCGGNGWIVDADAAIAAMMGGKA